MSLKEKRVVIIGGSAGIGKATARAALGAGASVVVASRSEEELSEARRELGASVATCVLDVRDARETDYCFSQIGSFDHLVVTAAEVHAAPFAEADVDMVRGVWDTKVLGPFVATQTALPYLREGGSVTLFSGVAAHRPARGLAVVAAANGAVEALARALALELSPLRVNAVCPGLIDTHAMSAEQRRAFAEALPARCVGEAADVAEAVLLLLQNRYITGTVLHIDGGKMIS